MTDKDRMKYLYKNVDTIQKVFDLEINVYFETKSKEDYVVIDDIVLQRLKIRDKIKETISDALSEYVSSLKTISNG